MNHASPIPGFLAKIRTPAIGLMWIQDRKSCHRAFLGPKYSRHCRVFAGSNGGCEGLIWCGIARRSINSAGTTVYRLR
jgi:hypothetical protein